MLTEVVGKFISCISFGLTGWCSPTSKPNLNYDPRTGKETWGRWTTGSPKENILALIFDRSFAGQLMPAAMAKLPKLLLFPCVLFLAILLRPSVADVGTAAHYGPPYLRKSPWLATSWVPIIIILCLDAWFFCSCLVFKIKESSPWPQCNQRGGWLLLLYVLLTS